MWASLLHCVKGWKVWKSRIQVLKSDCNSCRVYDVQFRKYFKTRCFCGLHAKFTLCQALLRISPNGGTDHSHFFTDPNTFLCVVVSWQQAKVKLKLGKRNEVEISTPRNWLWSLFKHSSPANRRGVMHILRYWCDTLNIEIIPPTDLAGFCLGRGNTSLSPSSLSIPVPSELRRINMEPMFCSPLLWLSPDDTNTTIARGKNSCQYRRSQGLSSHRPCLAPGRGKNRDP